MTYLVCVMFKLGGSDDPYKSRYEDYYEMCEGKAIADGVYKFYTDKMKDQEGNEPKVVYSVNMSVVVKSTDYEIDEIIPEDNAVALLTDAYDLLNNLEMNPDKEGFSGWTVHFALLERLYNYLKGEPIAQDN